MVANIVVSSSIPDSRTNRVDWVRAVRYLLLLVLILLLTACATQPRVVRHGFEFDVRWDSPDIELLDYYYGTSNHPGARNSDEARRTGRCIQAAGVHGDMTVGDSFFAKWRVKSTGEVYQDTVDLRKRLPADIVDHTIRFVIEGAQLYIYLISPERLQKHPCQARIASYGTGKGSKPRDRVLLMYCFKKIREIYPQQIER